MRAQPRPTTAHSTAQYIAHSFLTTTAHSEGSLLIFLASADFLHQGQEELSVAALVPCQPLQSVVTVISTYLVHERGARRGGRSFLLSGTPQKRR